MKLNNKGFAISTILYGLLALLILIVMLIFQVMRANNNNNKELSESINTELNLCREYRIKYNSCLESYYNDSGSSCNKVKDNYSGCLDCQANPNPNFSTCMTNKGLST